MNGLLIHMAWRNVWRNRRRTLITMGSIIMAVMLSSVMVSMQQGQYDQMIDQTVGSFTGHAQIMNPSFRVEPSLDHSLKITDSLVQSLTRTPEIAQIIPRIDSYALAAGPQRTQAGMVIGIDVEAEKYLSKPDQHITAGRYFLDNSEHGVLIGSGLAQRLNVNIGDSLVLMSTGYRGLTAADLIPITGIFSFGLPDLNNQIMYIPIHTAQYFYGLDGQVSSIALLTHNSKDVSAVTTELNTHLPASLQAYDWMSLVPELVQAIQADRGSGFIVLLVLYMVVGFGIFGTILMMTAERRYEFGVLLAIGTSRARIAGMLVLEMVMLTFFGTLAGMLAAFPVMLYFHWYPLSFSGEAAMAIEEYGMEPFIRFSIDPQLLMNQAFIVAVITLLICLYPLLHTRKLEPVSAMRS